MDNPNKYAVVLVTHENGNKEFCRMNYNTGVIDGSIGFNAMGGDIEKARKSLYPELKRSNIK